MREDPAKKKNALMAPQTQPKLSACGTDGRSEQGNDAILIAAASLILTHRFIPCATY
jgi:hypothetical protein